MMHFVTCINKKFAATYKEMDSMDKGLINMSGAIRELQGESSEFAGITSRLCKYFDGALQDVEGVIKAFSRRLAQYRRRLRHIEKGLYSHSRRLFRVQDAVEDLQRALLESQRIILDLHDTVRDSQDAIQSLLKERQGKRNQDIQLERYLRRYVPSNEHVRKAYCSMVAKAPAGDLAYLHQCWKKAADLQSDTSYLTFRFPQNCE
jgi:chromosome segregation ATPase